MGQTTVALVYGMKMTEAVSTATMNEDGEWVRSLDSLFPRSGTVRIETGGDGDCFAFVVAVHGCCEDHEAGLYGTVALAGIEGEYREQIQEAEDQWIKVLRWAKENGCLEVFGDPCLMLTVVERA